MVEQRFRKPQVDGSNPSVGSTLLAHSGHEHGFLGTPQVLTSDTLTANLTATRLRPLSEKPVQFPHGLCLNAWEHVAIRAKGDRYLAMAEQFLDDLGVHSQAHEGVLSRRGSGA